MMKTLAVLLAAVLAASVLAPERAIAQPRAITVKIEGSIGKPPEEGRPRGTWHIRVNSETVTLYVTKLDILAGATTNAEVIRHLKANRGSVLASGGKAALKTLEESPDGTMVVIQGTMRWAETPSILLVSTASKL